MLTKTHRRASFGLGIEVWCDKWSENREEKSEKGKKTETKVSGSIQRIRLRGQSLTGTIKCQCGYGGPLLACHSQSGRQNKSCRAFRECRECLCLSTVNPLQLSRLSSIGMIQATNTGGTDRSKACERDWLIKCISYMQIGYL